MKSLEEIASSHGLKPSQLALAWVLAQPWNILPIPATRSVSHLLDNVAAIDIELRPDELEAVSMAIPPGQVQGARHPAEHMKTINQ